MTECAFQQDPQTIFAAHRLDSERRDLFVEGAEDRRFLRVLAGDRLAPAAAIREIGTVKISGNSNKRRLLEFAVLARSQSRIRFFADADFDRICGRTTPSNVWLTDCRDLEHYLLDDRSIAKVWGVALGRNQVDARGIRDAVLSAGRTLGILRFMSEADGSCLPFQRTALVGRIAADEQSVMVDLKRLLEVLLQNAGRSLRELSELERKHQEWTLRYEEAPSCDLAHGKDCLVLVSEMIKSQGVARQDAPKLMWAAFDLRFIDRYPALREVLEFVTDGRATENDVADAATQVDPVVVPGPLIASQRGRIARTWGTLLVWMVSHKRHRAGSA